jgi:hypothetical protein
LGSFEDTRYRSEYKSSALEKVELIGLGVGKELQDLISQTVYQCAGVILARQLVNSPANVLTPSKYAFPFSSNHCRRMYIIYLLAVFQADKHLTLLWNCQSVLTTPLNKWGSKLLDFTIYQCTAACFSAQVDEGLITFVCSRMFVIKCMCMF